MGEREYTFSFQVHEHFSALPRPDQVLLNLSQYTCGSAYAPYSKFRVGVAIRTTDGVTVTGSNQENGAYPIGQCAERVALYQLVHTYGRMPIDTIAIAIDHETHHTPVSPCGSCRQILNEYRSFQDTPLRLLLCSTHTTQVIEIVDITHLLPLAFDGNFLGY